MAGQIDWSLAGQAGQNIFGGQQQIAQNIFQGQQNNANRLQQANIAQMQINSSQAINQANLKEQSREFDQTYLLTKAKDQIENAMNTEKLKSMVFSGIAQNPSADNYKSGLMTLSKMGIDTSDAPKDFGADAMGYLNTKFAESGQNLEVMKVKQAQAALDLQKLQLTKSIQDSDRNYNLDVAKFASSSELQKLQETSERQKIAMLAPFTGIGDSASSQGMLQGNPAAKMQLSGYNPTFGPTFTPQSSSQPQGAVSGLGPGGQVTALTTNAQGLPVEAVSKGTEEQLKDWVTYKKELAQAQAAGLNNQSATDVAQEKVNELGRLTGPGIGRLSSLLPSGEDLNSASAQLKLREVENMAITTGLKRMNSEVFKTVADLTPGTNKYKSTNEMLIARANIVNNIVQAETQLAPILEKAGLPDRSINTNLVNNAVIQTGAIDPKTGALNMTKFNQWPKYLPDNIKNQLARDNPSLLAIANISEADIAEGAKHGYSYADLVRGAKLLTQGNLPTPTNPNPNSPSPVINPGPMMSPVSLNG